ncbi:MAG: hypothetical protein HYZ58_09575 [Acidobacteria bacterium]|nr:hypothetical protein [Acidobacteriota bacterium]
MGFDRALVSRRAAIKVVLAVTLSGVSWGCPRGGAKGERNSASAHPSPAPAPSGLGASEAPIDLEAQQALPGPSILRLSVLLPEGCKFNDLGPTSVTLSASAAAVRFQPEGQAATQERVTISQPAFPLALPVRLAEGRSTLTADMKLYYCEAEGPGLCYFQCARLVVPVDVRPDATGNEILLSYTVPPAPK